MPSPHPFTSQNFSRPAAVSSTYTSTQFCSPDSDLTISLQIPPMRGKKKRKTVKSPTMVRSRAPPIKAPGSPTWRSASRETRTKSGTAMDAICEEIKHVATGMKRRLPTPLWLPNGTLVVISDQMLDRMATGEYLTQSDWLVLSSIIAKRVPNFELVMCETKSPSCKLAPGQKQFRLGETKTSTSAQGQPPLNVRYLLVLEGSTTSAHIYTVPETSGPLHRALRGLDGVVGSEAWKLSLSAHRV